MNDLSNLAETIFRYGLLALREMAVMPRLVLQDFANEDAQKGSVINIPVARAKTARGVVAGSPPTYDPMDMDVYSITMDQWRYAAFQMSDREKKEAQERGIFPANASEALKTLCNELDTYIITKMRAKCPYTSGAPGTTPDSTTHITALRKVLKKNLAGTQDRALVVSSDVEENFLNLSAFTNVNESGRLEGLVEGNLGRKYGFDIAGDQNFDDTNLTTGTHGGTPLVNGAASIGATSVNVDGGTGTVKAGETLQFASSSQKYVVQTDVADLSSATLQIWPPLRSAIADNEAITFTYAASTVVTYHGAGFNPKFFGLVNRRFEPVDPGLGSLVFSDQDPVTGLILRLEITRENKMTNWVWDMLYGGDVIRPDEGALLIG